LHAELRTTLSTRFGLDLPVTLLYDEQSVQALADYIAARLSSGTPGTTQRSSAAAFEHDGGDQDDECSDEEGGAGVGARQRRGGGLLKVLRSAIEEPPPLFTFAPGVAAGG
jgi:hypothetical protein